MKGNTKKFLEIQNYFIGLNFEKNLILLFSQWNEDEEIFKKFKKFSNINGLNNFIKFCNNNGLLLDDIETNRKGVSQKVIDSLASASYIDPQSSGDNER
ncbi:MAG: hypothetical protein Q9M94_06590 [Candidatus Gracilibacteria bacterium]|nr:hypothetical protein [Candidatus Gracilibacteria bacterium]MDQ7022977.1 hypothetical protein [Candidatus Gracilibacteria bacterium]